MMHIESPTERVASRKCSINVTADDDSGEVFPAMLLLWPNFQAQTSIYKAASDPQQYPLIPERRKWVIHILGMRELLVGLHPLREDGPKGKGKYEPPGAQLLGYCLSWVHRHPEH